MASAEARAYNGGLGVEPCSEGPGGRAPGGGSEAKPPPAEAPPLEADEVFVFKAVIFNASATVLHEMMYCLSCFF